MLVNPLGNFMEDLHVRLDDLLDTRAEDLQNHGLAIGPDRPVRLPDRGRCQRFFLDGTEMSIKVTEFRDQFSMDFIPGAWRNLALEFLELLDPVGREDIGTGTQDLTELDERRPEFFKGSSKSTRTGQLPDFLGGSSLIDDLLTLVTEQVQFRFREKLPETVLHRHRHDLSVSICILDGGNDADEKPPCSSGEPL